MPAPEPAARLGELADTGLAVPMGVALGVEAAPGDELAEVAAAAADVTAKAATPMTHANGTDRRATRPSRRLLPAALRPSCARDPPVKIATTLGP
jgi:hypothetical protein